MVGVGVNSGAFLNDAAPLRQRQAQACVMVSEPRAARYR